MKAAVLIAHYNKNAQLRNTLTGIAKQVVTFPFEVCIVDDHSTVDPLPDIVNAFPNVKFKYKRLEKNVYAQYTQKYCYDLVSDDVDTIIIMSCDVIMVDTNIIEELCQRLYTLKGRHVVTGDVRNINFSEGACKDFEFEIDKAMEVWDISQTYSNPIRLYLFMTAIKRSILDASEFKNNNCDMVMDASLRRLSCAHGIYDDLRAIHQKHPSVIHPCPIVDQCTFPCMRKKNYGSNLAGKKAKRRLEHPK